LGDFIITSRFGANGCESTRYDLRPNDDIQFALGKQSRAAYICKMFDFDNLSQEPGDSKSLPFAQTALLIFLLIGYPLISIWMTLSGGAQPLNVTSRIVQIYMPTLLIEMIILFLVVIVLRMTRTPFAEAGFGRGDINWGNVVSGLIFFIGAWTIITLLEGAVTRSGLLPQRNYLYLLPRSVSEKIFWLFLALGAALSEEITFRGYIITRLRIVTGSYWVGAILSSLAFSVGHLYQGVAGLFLTFIYGMLFSGLFVARKSVVPCIIAHFLQDALVVAALVNT
jgi:membrane protease YdiL (CAAX protease family)